MEDIKDLIRREEVKRAKAAPNVNARRASKTAKLVIGTAIIAMTLTSALLWSRVDGLEEGLAEVQSRVESIPVAKHPLLTEDCRGPIMTINTIPFCSI